MCVSFIIMCAFASLPAEAVAAQSQLQCIRSPSIVDLALENRVVPWDTARATLSKRSCASV